MSDHYLVAWIASLITAVLIVGILTMPGCAAINTCLTGENKNPVLCELVIQNSFPITERMLDEKHAR